LSVQRITIYTDGGARGNPGPAGIGAVILDEHGGVLKEISDYIGEATNNFAEYEALIRALSAARELFGKKLKEVHVEVCMDSELIVRQLEGRYRVKEPALKEQFARVGQLIATVPHISFVHVVREHNLRADELVNAAIDAALK
jgi:ribonuclease HI